MGVKGEIRESWITASRFPKIRRQWSFANKKIWRGKGTNIHGELLSAKHCLPFNSYQLPEAVWRNKCRNLSSALETWVQILSKAYLLTLALLLHNSNLCLPNRVIQSLLLFICFNSSPSDYKSFLSAYHPDPYQFCGEAGDKSNPVFLQRFCWLVVQVLEPLFPMTFNWRERNNFTSRFWNFQFLPSKSQYFSDFLCCIIRSYANMLNWVPSRSLVCLRKLSQFDVFTFSSFTSESY